MNYQNLMTTERVALLTWGLMLGTTYTTAQAADLTGLSCDGAYRMLRRVSRVLPIHCENGRWRALTNC